MVEHADFRPNTPSHDIFRVYFNQRTYQKQLATNNRNYLEVIPHTPPDTFRIDPLHRFYLARRRVHSDRRMQTIDYCR